MIKFILYLLLVALVHSKLEIMIEGKAGWALKLPCWRIDNPFTRFILGKELTGYHFYLLLLFFIIFHGTYLFVPFSLKTEMLVLGLFSWYWLVEDFFWFIESKHYGLRSFKKGRIYWHKRWCLGLPVSYWGGIIIGSVLVLLYAIL